MKKIGLICLAVVLAMGALGIGYAVWTDEVTVSGDITTGEVCIDILCPITIEDGDTKPPPYEGIGASELDWNATTNGTLFYQNPVQTTKNVGWTTAACIGNPPYKSATINFNNVYPCYWNHLSLGIHNCGTIPVKLDRVVFKDSSGMVLFTIYDDGYLVFDLSDNQIDDFEMYWGDNFGDQIEPCDTWDISFWVHFLQDEGIDFSVPQSYSFTIEIHAIQWNEY